MEIDYGKNKFRKKPSVNFVKNSLATVVHIYFFVIVVQGLKDDVVISCEISCISKAFCGTLDRKYT